MEPTEQEDYSPFVVRLWARVKTAVYGTGEFPIKEDVQDRALSR